MLYQEERTRRDHPVTGRAALWHVYQRFRLERGQSMYVDMSTLLQLSFQGDLEAFLDAWDYALMAMKRLPDEDLLLALLEAQLRGCKALAPAFLVFDASPEGSANRTSTFIYNAARQEVVRKQREATKAGLIKHVNKAAPAKPGPGTPAAPAAPAAPAPKQGQGPKGKSKGKDAHKGGNATKAAADEGQKQV